MRRIWLAVLPALFALSSSCIFLYDFDDLQGGDSADAGTGGGVSNGGAGTDGGDGGNPCGICDDTDPCTRDFCDETVSPPTCRSEPAGVALDGFETRISADEMHRVSITSGPDAFFVSVFETTNSQPEVTIYHLGTSSAITELQAIAQASALGVAGASGPSSGAAMVVDTTVGQQLHAYLGIREADIRSRVYHVVIDGTLSLRSWEPLPEPAGPGAPTYDDTLPTRMPVAWKLRDTVYAAWIDTSGGITAHSPGTELMSFGSATDPTMRASTLAPFGSLAGTPGVAWTGPGLGAFAQLLGKAPLPLLDCTPTPGLFVSSTSAYAQIGGLWFYGWTKAGDGFLVSESRLLLCDNADNCFTDETCSDDSVAPAVRNVASDTLRRQEDPASVFLHATAIPYLTPDESSNGTLATLVLSVQRFDFGPNPLAENSQIEVQEIGSVTLAAAATSAAVNWDGPDWPALSIAPPNKLLVGWIEPTSTGKDVVLQRYEICLP
jgi:hypothetical protein